MIDMTLHKILKTLSILSYLLIFLKSEVIGGPMIILMLVALYNTDILTQIFIILAFLGLITVAVLTLFKKNYCTFFIELIICFLLTLPIINELKFSKLQLLHYPMFVIPVICFLLFYMLSLCFSYGVEKRDLSIKSN